MIQFKDRENEKRLVARVQPGESPSSHAKNLIDRYFYVIRTSMLGSKFSAFQLATLTRIMANVDFKQAPDLIIEAMRQAVDEYNREENIIPGLRAKFYTLSEVEIFQLVDYLEVKRASTASSGR